MPTPFNIPNDRSALVIVVDGLGAGYLGPYGNTWIDTPACNELASESILSEFALATGSDLGSIYDSYWQGRHPWQTPQESLINKLTASDIWCDLVTDEPELAAHPQAAEFSRLSPLAPPPEPQAASLTPQASSLGRMFTAALESYLEADGPSLVWAHARGMYGPWDAPEEYRYQWIDEEDPPPPDVIEPPAFLADNDVDPDELLGLTHAYAGQVVLFDLCLEALLSEVAASARADRTLVIVTGSRGFPLGEHQEVGLVEGQLHGELLQVPFLMRVPDGSGALARHRGLVQTSDTYATLADWFGLAGDDTPWSKSLLPLAFPTAVPWRQRACAANTCEAAIRTPAWFLRTNEQAGHQHLYVKPDDRWEVNEVSGRCAAVTEELVGELQQFKQAATDGRLAELPALSEQLTEGPK